MVKDWFETILGVRKNPSEKAAHQGQKKWGTFENQS